MDSPFHVPLTLDWMGRFVVGNTRLWKALGNAESAFVQAGETPITAPVYICGLARAGSTILLETLAAQPNAVTHRYQDFPFLFTPYGWNLMLTLLPRKIKKRERAHGDGIMVNAESPEAMEEMLWMAFFAHLHRGTPEILDHKTTSNLEFDRFYRQHIRKLLHVRGGNRYISKSNYTLTRMGYIARLFPDARFIVPVRDPVSHIASLMRQHARFCEAGKKDPRVVRHMSIAGHFEFGLNRMPIHTGDDERFTAIQRAWQRGEEVRGWALYWDMIYNYTYKQLYANTALKEQTIIVPFEKLCSHPDEMLRKILSHVDIPIEEKKIAMIASTFRTPDYYQPTLTDADKVLIKKITGDTAKKIFG